MATSFLSLITSSKCLAWLRAVWADTGLTVFVSLPVWNYQKSLSLCHGAVRRPRKIENYEESRGFQQLLITSFMFYRTIAPFYIRILAVNGAPYIGFSCYSSGRV